MEKQRKRENEQLPTYLIQPYFTRALRTHFIIRILLEIIGYLHIHRQNI